MPTAPSNEAPALSAWMAESLRLTAFHSQVGPQLDDHNWWERIVGEQPESKVMKPREGGYEVTGPFQGGVLSLKASFGRFDWLYSPSTTFDANPTQLPTIGTLTESVAAFQPIMTAWLALVPDVTRLAFGAVILQNTADRIAGYQLLSRYLPAVRIDAANSSDFFYAINRPRQHSLCGGVRINRLSRWSVGVFQAMMIRVVAGQGPAADAASGSQIYAIRAELDVNSDAERTVAIPQSDLLPLFSHLVDSAKEIASEGDIP